MVEALAFDEPLMSPKDVASNLSVDITTVHRWIREGKLEAIRLPGDHALRVPRRALEHIRAGAGNVRP